MKAPVFSPKPPMSAAIIGITIKATSGDIFLLMMAAESATMVNKPNAASIPLLLSRQPILVQRVQPQRTQRDAENDQDSVFLRAPLRPSASSAVELAVPMLNILILDP